MRPAICAVCGRPAVAADGALDAGDWVGFADHAPSAQGAAGHPAGLEYFCAQHLPAAQALASTPSPQALVELRCIYAADVGAGALPARPVPWWKRWS